MMEGRLPRRHSCQSRPQGMVLHALLPPPESRAEEETCTHISRDDQTHVDPRTLYWAARDQCKLHMSRPVDLSLLAWCTYIHYPLVSPVYPPDLSGRDWRLRGIVILPVGGSESIPAGAAFQSVGGGLILDFFHYAIHGYEYAVHHADLCLRHFGGQVGLRPLRGWSQDCM